MAAAEQPGRTEWHSDRVGHPVRLDVEDLALTLVGPMRDSTRFAAERREDVSLAVDGQELVPVRSSRLHVGLDTRIGGEQLEHLAGSIVLIA